MEQRKRQRSERDAFETMIAWGRYAGLMDYNTKTRMVFVPREEDSIEEASDDMRCP